MFKVFGFVLLQLLFHRSRFDPALGGGVMSGTAKISVLFPAKIRQAG